MIKKYFLPSLPLVAVLGVIVIIVAIILDNRPKVDTQPALQLPKVPFSYYVSGAGLIEAASGNIAVGTPVAGIVTAIYVKWGDHVRAGDRLFKIDDRDLLAQKAPALAYVNEAQAKLMQAQGQLKLAESVPDRRAISEEEINNRRSAVAIAKTALESANARVEQLKLAIERQTIRALAAGKILQINIHPGEFAQSGVVSKPLVLFGSDDSLYLRVDVDEFDASRISAGAAAMAFVRGASAQSIPLKFERIEPYLVPKTAMTGNAAERIDTRVLQVIYSFNPRNLTVYVGQQMDVYIQTPSDAAPNSKTAAAATNTPAAEKSP